LVIGSEKTVKIKIIRNLKIRSINGRKNLQASEARKRFRYAMLLYDHSLLAKLKPEANREILLCSNSEGSLKDLYWDRYFPRWEKVLSGTVVSILLGGVK